MQNEILELLKNRLEIEAKKQDRGGVYALTQRKLAYNSNRIEGRTLTKKQTASIFETGVIKADGKGRCGRMILFKECLRCSIMPFIIEDDR